MLGVTKVLVFHIVMDVTHPESVENAVEWVEENLHGLDMLVNNSGIGMMTVNNNFSTDPKPFFEVPLDKFRELINKYLTGYFIASSRFVRIFKAEKWSFRERVSEPPDEGKKEVRSIRSFPVRIRGAKSHNGSGSKTVRDNHQYSLARRHYPHWNGSGA